MARQCMQRQSKFISRMDSPTRVSLICSLERMSTARRGSPGSQTRSSMGFISELQKEIVRAKRSMIRRIRARHSCRSRSGSRSDQAGCPTLSRVLCGRVGFHLCTQPPGGNYFSTLVDSPRVGSRSIRSRYAYSSLLDRASKFSAVLAKDDRILTDIAAESPQFSLAPQGFLCISKYCICPLQKFCSLLDNSPIHELVSLEIETSYEQSLPIEVAAVELYCLRLNVSQPETQRWVVIRNDVSICRSEVSINRRGPTCGED
jgi:hypothetical protein